MQLRCATMFVWAALAGAPCALAQWPTNPATNLAIGDAAGEQTLAKIAPTWDGGCYLGWFDNRSGSYAVYLQRLDASGNELWPHGGILVSGNPQSTSLVDWDLICDSWGFCVLTFTDTRAGSDLDIYAYRITDNGTFLWGANGVTVSNNNDYEANPRVVEASDGDFVIAWANSGTSTVHHQRLDPAGTPRFAGDGIAYPGDAGANPGFVSMVASDNGAVILSWVRTLAFLGNKHVHAQKFDVLGAPTWNGGTRIAVFDQASVPIAHQPRMIPAWPGAILAWHYAQGQQFFVRVQYLDGSGTERFAHNGVDVSTSSNSRFDPAIVWDNVTDGVFVSWNERNVAQTSWGIFAQHLDSTGAPLWGSTGVNLLPINTTVKFAPVATFRIGGGLTTSVLVESLGGMQDTVQSYGLDANGALTCAATVSTAPSDKLRLTQASTYGGATLLAWTDQRSGAADVYAQAIDLAGGIGLTLGQILPYGCGQNPAGSLVVGGDPFGNGRASPGNLLTVDITNPLGTQPPGSAAFVIYSLGGLASPCGFSLPGFGMAVGQPGEVLVDLNQGLMLLAGMFNGIDPVRTYLPLPGVGSVLGASIYVQGLMVDLSPAPAVQFGLTTTTELRIGS
ncbi:MAG: hypothetical protein K8J09_06940 [Planctomycetes bacterium]|nr:hypothetical protein [Planctomycetota bacterium]